MNYGGPQSDAGENEPFNPAIRQVRRAPPPSGYIFFDVRARDGGAEI
jgi:hypothetical protein